MFVDGAFAGNFILSSKIGMVTIMYDENHSCEIIHYGSCKSKRKTESALSAELYSVVCGLFTSLSCITQLNDPCVSHFIYISTPTQRAYLIDSWL